MFQTTQQPHQDDENNYNPHIYGKKSMAQAPLPSLFIESYAKTVSRKIQIIILVYIA